SALARRESRLAGAYPVLELPARLGVHLDDALLQLPHRLVRHGPVALRASARHASRRVPRQPAIALGIGHLDFRDVAVGAIVVSVGFGVVALIPVEITQPAGNHLLVQGNAFLRKHLPRLRRRALLQYPERGQQRLLLLGRAPASLVSLAQL